MNDDPRRQPGQSLLRQGLRPDPEAAAETRWLRKPVEKSRPILLPELFDRVRLVGPGVLNLSPGKGRNGGPCLSLDFPAVQQVQDPGGRAYSTSEVIIPFDHEDLSEFNRLLLWVYAESGGSAVNYLTLSLRNAGPRVMPVPGRFEGYHSASVPSGAWTPIPWEFPDLSRNDITALVICAFAVGTSYPWEPPRIRLFLDDPRLETVDADRDKGFALGEDKIAYCHSGYRLEDPKQALVRRREGVFTLKDEGGGTVFTAAAVPWEEDFSLLDFSSFAGEGRFSLGMGDLETPPFVIGSQAYVSAAWKTLNFFFMERCGCTVPGTHTECHLDVMSVHPDGRKRCVAGGWHDAGDLTQDGRNTMESTLAMLELARAAGRTELSAQALEEARRGLDWMMRTRWGDGYRHCGRIIGIWTRNTLGDGDDMETVAENRPYDNLLSAEVFARAAEILREEDPLYARLCARYAREDFRFGVEWMNRPPDNSFSQATQLQLNAIGALSAAALYKAFGGEGHLRDAAGFARIVMNCQRKEAPPSFRLPLRGYFYETETHERVQAYFHRSYEHVPLQALCRLLEAAPDHPDAEKWRNSLDLYAEYLRMIAGLTPYGVLPAGVYELDNADFSNLYHEGDREKGGPSMAEFNAQVRKGIPLDDRHYLRVFPAAFQFRGFHAVIMGKAIAALEMAGALKEPDLRSIGVRQLEWILGYNPFACSSMYGEGYDFHPLYTGLQPQIVGAVPVGFETWENEDIPYYPVQNLPTYKEIWVHTTCRLMRCAALMGFPGGVEFEL